MESNLYEQLVILLEHCSVIIRSKDLDRILKILMTPANQARYYGELDVSKIDKLKASPDKTKLCNNKYPELNPIND